MSVPDFCVAISKFIQAESLEKDETSNNFRPYMRHPEIKCSTFTSIATAVNNKKYLVYGSGMNDDRFKIYAVTSREGIEENGALFDGAIQKFKNLSWETFDDFTYCTKRIKILYGSAGDVRCTCYKFSREHHCVHSLLLRYLGNEKTVVSKVLENTRLARTKKARGNTKKARPALAIQPNTPVLAGGINNTSNSSKLVAVGSDGLRLSALHGPAAAAALAANDFEF